MDNTEGKRGICTLRCNKVWGKQGGYKEGERELERRMVRRKL